MATESITLGYSPRPQFVPFHCRKQRWSVIVAHRRCGKTVACIMDLVDAALRSTKANPRYAYVAPMFVQAKDVAWAYVKQFTQHIPGAEFNESELRVDFASNGGRIRLYGADSYDRMRGLYFDGVVLDEAADFDPRAWPEVIRPALSDRRGWATFIGTPKGRNAFFELYDAATRKDDWYDLMLRASETEIVPESELLDAQSMMTPEQYAQEYECSFEAAIVGAYYGREVAAAEREGRICNVPYDANVPCFAAWDLGKGANMAVWIWQVVGKEIHVIDYHEGEHSDGIPQTVTKLRAKGYPIKADWVPHDAKATEIGTGRTRVEQLLSLNRVPLVVPDHKEMDGIAGARLTIPRCYFDKIKCADGLEALRQFRADFDAKTRAFKDNPKPDWTNHAADAFRYLAMAWREMMPAKEKTRITVDTRTPTLNDITKRHFANHDNSGPGRI
jgi:phage terminase large subunit